MIRLTERPLSELRRFMWLFMHPDIYPYTIDDHTNRDLVEEKLPQVFNRPGVRLLIVRDDEEAVGYFSLIPWNTITYEFHLGFLKSHRGKFALMAATLLKDFVYNVVGGKCLIVGVPAFNYSATSYAEKIGMTLNGIIPQSFLKNGKLFDILLYSLKLGG